MPANFVALSDLHLGYDNSLLSEKSAQENLATAIADLCSGETDRLILNGDAFEACVPRDAGQMDTCGYSPYMAECARSFFDAILAKVKVTSLIIIPGNHDYSMWKRLSGSCGVGTFTNGTKGDVLLQCDSQIMPGAEPFLDDIVGTSRSKLTRIRAAYPNYILGRFWPYLVFHHGHLLDDLILGQNNEVEYAGLKILTGVGKPAININDDTTIASLHAKTDSFIAATWAFNSKVRQIEWAMIRRGDKTAACSYYPINDPIPSSKLVPTSEPQGAGLGHNGPWYANVLMADPTTPPPIGNPGFPSYLFVGHDHAGGFADFLGMDDRPWKLVNTGGWTNDGGGRNVHGHVTIWTKDDEAPTVHCVSV